MRRWFRNGFGLAWHCLRQKKLGGNFSTLKSHFDSDKFPESAGNTTHSPGKSEKTELPCCKLVFQEQKTLKKQETIFIGTFFGTRKKWVLICCYKIKKPKKLFCKLVLNTSRIKTS